MNRIFLLGAFVFLLTGSLWSQKAVYLPNSPAEYVIEDIYIHVGLGYPAISYSRGLQEDIDVLNKTLSGSQEIVLGVHGDVYWPLANKKTLIGGSISGFVDSYKGTNSTMNINFFQVGGSVQHYLLSWIGKGLFIRGDVGVASGTVDIEFKQDNVTLKTSAETEVGFGVLVGGGYAIPISSGTRLTLDVYYEHQSITNAAVNFVHFGAGILW